jgi:hypothetical protein
MASNKRREVEGLPVRSLSPTAGALVVVGALDVACVSVSKAIERALEDITRPRNRCRALRRPLNWCDPKRGEIEDPLSWQVAP